MGRILGRRGERTEDKSETRNPKSETNSKSENGNCLNPYPQAFTGRRGPRPTCHGGRAPPCGATDQSPQCIPCHRDGTGETGGRRTRQISPAPEGGGRRGLVGLVSYGVAPVTLGVYHDLDGPGVFLETAGLPVCLDGASVAQKRELRDVLGVKADEHGFRRDPALPVEHKDWLRSLLSFDVFILRPRVTYQ